MEKLALHEPHEYYCLAARIQSIAVQKQSFARESPAFRKNVIEGNQGMKKTDFHFRVFFLFGFSLSFPPFKIGIRIFSDRQKARAFDAHQLFDFELE